MKALDAAISARQWKKAVQIIQVIDDDTGELNKYYLKIGQHYESVREYHMAQRFYMKVSEKINFKQETILKGSGKKIPHLKSLNQPASIFDQNIKKITKICFFFFGGSTFKTFFLTKSSGQHGQACHRDVQQGRDVGGGAPAGPTIHGQGRGKQYSIIRLFD